MLNILLNLRRDVIIDAALDVLVILKFDFGIDYRKVQDFGIVVSVGGANLLNCNTRLRMI